MNAQTIAAITGGAVAGIVVAAIIAAVIMFYLAKKGYDYYMAQSDAAAAGLHTNPYYHENAMAGEIPTMDTNRRYGGPKN